MQHVKLFGFMAGYQQQTYKVEDSVNIDAAYLMGKLHDSLKEAGYTGHELEKYLVRILFCLFAEDTTIFEKRLFQEYIENNTKEDGTDLGLHLAQLFQILNTTPERRQKTLDESLTAFPYVNGQLFAEQLSFASFNSNMRKALLDCCTLDWSKISPAIFGSMFQSVMDEQQRRNLGAHYTSEKNILKVIKPLFLDKLWQEFEAIRNNSNKLKQFQRKIASLRFLDPACGCGNFLVITYRELRLLELEILKELQKGQRVLDLESLMQCNVDRFYGIEYEEFPAQIAQVALWLIDHQMNMRISQEFGEYFVRLPLRKSAKIVHGNALRTDWDSIIEPLQWDKETDLMQFDYIIGNPPFIGKTWQNQSQREDVDLIFNGVDGSGLLDYVSCWYLKAAQYMQSVNSIREEKGYAKTRSAFVSTNSISQGEQVSVLWNELIYKYNIKINFAHRTFKWTNEAKGKAAVHCVIIGFANFDTNDKTIYEYDDINSEPHEIKAKNINPYLVDAKDVLITRRSNPICNVPQMIWGNKPVDGGHLIFTSEEKYDFIEKEPLSNKYFKKFIGGQEFIQGKERWCLWFADVNPSEFRNMKHVTERIALVKETRLKSTDIGARKLADRPTQFRDLINPKSFIAIPEVSTERRKYIPIGFLNEESIASNKLQMIPNGTVYHFGILTSIMHMTWMRQVCGRMKSDYSYSNSIVYNNFPWPENPTDKQKEAIEKAAQKVLDTREVFPGSSLADLYDPLTMPPALVKAHQELDKTVDLAYRPQPFQSETKRIEFLFEVWERYTRGMFHDENKKKSNKKKL